MISLFASELPDCFCNCFFQNAHLPSWNDNARSTSRNALKRSSNKNQSSVSHQRLRDPPVPWMRQNRTKNTISLLEFARNTYFGSKQIGYINNKWQVWAAKLEKMQITLAELSRGIHENYVPNDELCQNLFQHYKFICPIFRLDKTSLHQGQENNKR